MESRKYNKYQYSAENEVVKKTWRNYQRSGHGCKRTHVIHRILS